jgi:hypothetical protein
MARTELSTFFANEVFLPAQKVKSKVCISKKVESLKILIVHFFPRF